MVVLLRYLRARVARKIKASIENYLNHSSITIISFFFFENYFNNTLYRMAHNASQVKFYRFNALP